MNVDGTADQRLGAPIVYLAVRDALIHAGVDVHSHPYTELERSSRVVWADAWDRIVNELAERGYVFAKWTVLLAMIEGDPNAAMWRNALLAQPPLDAPADEAGGEADDEKDSQEE